MIHKEGKTILVVLLVVLVATNFAVGHWYPDFEYFNLLVGSSFLLYILVLQFFRSPRVISLENENQVIAPADGKIVVIENVLEKEYLNENRIQISIFMSPLNAHVNRNPVSGIVKYFKYHPGQYLVAWHPKSSEKNERTTMVLELQNGLEILVRQIAGAMARRIKWYIEEGEQVTQGKEFGFIKFGSRVDVFVPLNSDVVVKIGDRTRAGKTVLAELR